MSTKEISSFVPIYKYCEKHNIAYPQEKNCPFCEEKKPEKSS